MRHEPALALRMLVALALSVALVGGVVAALLWLAIFVPSGWIFVAVVAAFVAEGVRVSRKGHESYGSREPTAADERRAQAAVERLALVASVPMPQVRVVRERMPLSWTTALSRRRAAIHVTTGMLDRLGDRKLHAVMAHEVAHLLHRDAILMTVLAAPPAYLLAGMRETVHEQGLLRGIAGWVVHGVLLGIPAALLLAVGRIVSRHRELVADRTAALLTGSAASVAAALVAVRDGLGAIPEWDLRLAASRDSLHFAPAVERRRLLRPWATHPSFAQRLERLTRV